MIYDHERFLANWKVDDKEWMKERHKGWKNIHLQLDRLRASDVFNGVKKSDYKYFKNYYLTGKDTADTPSEIAFRCLGRHSPDHNLLLVLQFWLSADHCEECLDYLKESLFSSYESNYFPYACRFYRETTKCYPSVGKYGWNKDEGTTKSNGPIFGDLETRMLALFSYTPELISFNDERILIDAGSTAQSSFEGVFMGYFGCVLEEPEIDCGFNPNNPIKNMVDEYIRWGFPKNRGDDDLIGFLIAIALIWHVVDTPEGRHPIQLEVAQKLKKGIIDNLEDMPEEAQNRYKRAMEYYESGEYKEYMVESE